MSDIHMARQVRVAPERLAGWLDGFAARHGHPELSLSDDELRLQCPDGAAAALRLPWGPLPGHDPLAEVVAQALRPRRVGAIIVRRRAHAVGIFEGAELVAGHHASHYVQGRTKAGGWSQQRYARRRANQAEHAFSEASADVASLLLATVDTLEAVVAGGDAAAVAAVLGGDEFARLRELRVGSVLPVPDPNRGVLAGFGAQFRQLSIMLNDRA
jgi:hypothetical protein